MIHNGMINNEGISIYISMSIHTHHQNKTLIEQDDQKATAVLKRMNLNTHRKLNQALTLQITQKTTSMKKKFGNQDTCLIVNLYIQYKLWQTMERNDRRINRNKLNFSKKSSPIVVESLRKSAEKQHNTFKSSEKVSIQDFLLFT